MAFIDAIKQRAKESIKTIILTESEDIRVLEAAQKADSPKESTAPDATIVLLKTPLRRSDTKS